MRDGEAVEFLKEVLSIYSPSGGEGELAAYLRDRLKRLGFAAEVDEMGNVIAALGDVPRREGYERPDLLFLGHIDTVPGFIPVREEGGRLYGRGAVDAKGPFVAFVVALVRARRALEGEGIVLVGAVGEESEGAGAKHLVPRFRPRAAIVGEPSGWNGIVLGYKGRLTVHYSVQVPVSHSASPEPTAPERALEFWRRLLLYTRRFNRGRTRRFDALDVALKRMGSAEDGLVDRAELSLVFRLPPGLDPGALRREVRRMANGAAVSFGGGERAFTAPKNTPLVRLFLRAIRAAGGRPRFVLKTGTSDMNLVGPVWGCPMVAYGPGDSRLDHTPHEHIEIAEFLRGISVLTRVLELAAAPPQ
ncbi:[LysW]-lysine hydrolase [Candidatus Bipolaricaulota sp. J31]